MSLRLALILPAVMLVACGEAPAPSAQTDPAPARQPGPPPVPPKAVPAPVYSIDSITFEIRESMPVQLVIKARGTVRTGGWSGGELRPLQTLAPEQGVRSFTFFATPPRPDMMVTQALAPIDAVFTIPALPADVKSIRIIAETNEMTETLP
jgi:hypothetical protein